MENEELSNEIESGRSKTNQCLGTERGKTDKTLNDLKAGRRRQTSNTLRRARLTADQTTLENRAAADKKRALTTGNLLSMRAHEEVTRMQLKNERNAADEMLSDERRRTDITIENERQHKQDSEQNAINRERKQTDVSLNNERSFNDEEVSKTTSALHQEKADHVVTKSGLTSREEILAIVSHDLKNPIGAIFSSAELLLEEYSDSENSNASKELLEVISRGASHAIRLIDDLLDMEAIETEKLHLQVASVDVVETVMHTLKIFAKPAAAKSISLKLEVPEASVIGMIDEGRIAQVLINLIGNAVKFTPKLGTITVSVAQSNGALQVTVQDTGPGIPEGMQEQIFERFSQLQNRHRTGLGLGLYISKKLVLQHHGKIWVTSKNGQGSAFTFTLPQRENAPALG